MSKTYDFEFDGEIQEKLNFVIAIEVIKKYLYKTNKITKEELNNIIKMANRSVKNSLKIS